MSNRIALTSLCLLIGLTVFAQNGAKWRVGVKTGLNYGEQHASRFPEFLGTDLNKIYNKSTTWDPGLSVGFQSKLHLSEKFSLNADLLYNQRAYTTTTKDTNFSEVKFINRLHYISLPIYGGFKLLPGLDIEFGAETSYLLDWTGKFQGQQIELINRDDISDFDFGVAGGLSYRINNYLALQGRYYRGVVNTVDVKFTDPNGNDLGNNAKFINHNVQLSLTVFPF